MTPTSSPTSSSRSTRVLKALGAGTGARIFGSLITLLSVPVAVRYLGPERYGVWATVSTTVIWINLLDLGVANSLTNHISRAFALDDRESAARAFANALFVTSAISLILATAFAALGTHLDWPRIFNVSAQVPQSEVWQTVAVGTGLMLLNLPMSLGNKLLAGYQELHVSSIAAAVSSGGSLAGLGCGICLGFSMPVLFLCFAGWTTASNAALMLLTITRYKPWLLPRPSFLDKRIAKELLSSGSSFFIIQFAGVVVFSSDNLIISHYLGAAEVTPYSVTWRMVGLAAILPSLLFPALWPAYAEAHARGDYKWVRSTFTHVLRGTGAINIALACVFLLAGRGTIGWWAGEAATPTRSLLTAMCLWMLISGLMNVESCLLAALNRTREQAVLSAIAAALNLALSIWLVQRVGSIGAIAGTILSYLLVLVVPQTLIVRNVLREMGDKESCPQRTYPEAQQLELAP